MKITVTTIKKYGNHMPKSFDFPDSVSRSASPSALHDITVKLPTAEHSKI